MSEQTVSYDEALAQAKASQAAKQQTAAAPAGPKGPFEVVLFAGTQGQTRATIGEYATVQEAQDYIDSLGGAAEGARYKIVPKATGYEVVVDAPPVPAPTVVSKHATLAEAQAAVVKLNKEGKSAAYRIVAKYPNVG